MLTFLRLGFTRNIPIRIGQYGQPLNDIIGILIYRKASDILAKTNQSYQGEKVISSRKNNLFNT